MAVAAPTPAFGAVEKQLKTLCLREFPCGPGVWRELEPISSSRQKKKPRQIGKGSLKKCFQEKEKSDPESLEAIKVQAQKEKSETLQELVNSQFSPWHLDYSWSEEAKELREIAVKSPWLIDKNFVLNYFKTLRIVDKNVSEVDENLLKLKNLTELTLSANFISNVNSKNLPASLKSSTSYTWAVRLAGENRDEDDSLDDWGGTLHPGLAIRGLLDIEAVQIVKYVLELCANQISDISGLCVRPPLLHHLGLGHNRISFLGDYVTGDFWPNLLSLDMSHNDLCDLMDIIRKLITLPKLRNLVLQGNPLSRCIPPSVHRYFFITIDQLIPGYRGYTIDCLRRLSVMDDVHISADERHHFKGLARRREFILDEAKVQIGITYIKGLPCPEEIKNSENQPEFPVVERTYFVQFMFPEERGGKAGEGTVEIGDDMADLAALEMEAAITDRPEGQPEHEQPRVSSPKSCASAEPQERNVQINSRPQMKSADVFSGHAQSSTPSFPRSNPNPDPEVKPGSVVEGIDLDFGDESQMGEGEEGKTVRDEQMEPLPRVKLVPVNSEPQPWAEELELNWTVDLTRDDLLALRDFFKQGMDFSVVEQVVLGYPAEPDSASDKTGEAKEGKDKKKEAPAKGKTSAKDKDKKKKKEPEVELIKSPPTFTTIATFHITLEHFLDGEFEYRNIFTKGDVPPPSTIRSVDHEDKKLEKKDSKDKKKAEKASDKKKDQNANAKKSPRAKESDKKGGKGKHAEEAEEDDLPPPPLELEVTVKLDHWVTAMDSVREEEERNRNLQGTKNKPNGSKENLKNI